MPYATRVPSRLTTTILKPFRPAPGSLQPTRDSSIYQVQEESTASGGLSNHLKSSSIGAGVRTIRARRNPWSRAILFLGISICERNLPAPLRGCDQPPGGKVAGHCLLWARFPMPSLHNWHEVSSVHLRTEARRLCVHCPPVMLDNKWICTQAPIPETPWCGYP